LRDLGWHSVYAGEVTYVDLYPFYLPSFYSSWEPDGITRWAVRNNEPPGGFAAQVNDTFFNTAGTGLYQYPAHFIPPQASPLYYPVDSFEGSAVVRSTSQPIAAIANLLYPPACADGALSYGGVSE